VMCLFFPYESRCSKIRKGFDGWQKIAHCRNNSKIQMW
jgi:hypothetical protein